MLKENTMGKFTRANKDGVYALGVEGEERLVASWVAGACVPQIVSMTKEEGGYALKYVNCNIYLYVTE